jgi:hypothetical protein
MFSRTTLVFIVVVLAILACVLLRRPTSKILSPDRLSYPCLRIYDGSLWEKIENETQLRTTPSGYYMNRKDDPLLIDSEFRVMTLSKLKMRGSEMGLLLTGPRPIEIEFELMLRPENSVPQAKMLVWNLIQKYEQTLTQSDSTQSDSSLTELIDLLQRSRVRSLARPEK